MDIECRVSTPFVLNFKLPEEAQSEACLLSVGRKETHLHSTVIIFSTRSKLIVGGHDGPIECQTQWNGAVEGLDIFSFNKMGGVDGMVSIQGIRCTICGCTVRIVRFVEFVVRVDCSPRGWDLCLFSKVRHRHMNT